MSHVLPEGSNAFVTGPQQHIDLEPVPAEDVVAGTPRQGTAVLGNIGGGDPVEVGIWELRDGTVTDTEVDEFFVVLSGGATIEFLDADGTVTETVEVSSGDVMRLTEGSRTRWTVPDHIRKVYIA